MFKPWTCEGRAQHEREGISRDCLALVLLESISTWSHMPGIDSKQQNCQWPEESNSILLHLDPASRSSINGCTAASFHRHEICCGKLRGISLTESGEAAQDWQPQVKTGVSESPRDWRGSMRGTLNVGVANNLNLSSHHQHPLSSRTSYLPTQSTCRPVQDRLHANSFPPHSRLPVTLLLKPRPSPTCPRPIHSTRPCKPNPPPPERGQQPAASCTCAPLAAKG